MLHSFDAQDLTGYACRLLAAAGVAAEHARPVADILVKGDLLGHDTHGLAQLPSYLVDIEAGRMAKHGEPVVLSDRPAALLWDGRRLPGPSLVLRAIETLVPRARDLGTATLTIRHSCHIACLAAYLMEATSQGFVMLLTCSDPSVKTVAPHGGTRAVLSPNPIALGVPTSNAPILIDISSSLTTNAMTARRHKAGTTFDEPWLLDADGHATREPGALFANPPGTILPLGGMSAGHKGFGLSLLIEALTAGLTGHGRADAPTDLGATVFITLYDPAAFGGGDALTRQMDWLADACRSNPPRPGTERVRMPGDGAHARLREQTEHGVRLHPAIRQALEPWSVRFGIPFPSPVDTVSPDASRFAASK